MASAESPTGGRWACSPCSTGLGRRMPTQAWQTAYSDSVPVLVLPQGHPSTRAGVSPLFNSVRAYAQITKSVEELNDGARLPDIMRRAFSQLKMGRPGPVMVEIPQDIALEEVDESALVYKPVSFGRSAGNPRDVDEAARVLVEARTPLIIAGQGVFIR